MSRLLRRPLDHVALKINPNCNPSEVWEKERTAAASQQSVCSAVAFIKNFTSAVEAGFLRLKQYD